jgi:hypothetical protein
MSEYTVETLEHGIEGCKKNIAVLETAIERERATIADYRIMQDSIVVATRKQEEAAAWAKTNVEITHDSPVNGNG